MKYKWKKLLFATGLSASLLLFTNCTNNDLEEEETEITLEQEEENKKEENKKEEKTDDERDKELEEFLSLSKEEKEEILDEVLDYKKVKASKTLTHITIHDERESTSPTINSMTNYGANGEVISQELVIGESNTEPVRKTFNGGVEESKGRTVEREEREEPEIYFSYYDILENLKEIREYLEVEQKKGETILSFETDDLEVYETLKDDFQIGLDTNVEKMTSSGEYRFNPELNLIQVSQTFQNDRVKIQIRSNFEELDVPYEVPEIN